MTSFALPPLSVQIVLFAIFAFFGWTLEVVWRSVARRRFVNAGFLCGPVLPIYGFGGLAIICLDSLLSGSHILVRMAAFAVFLTAIEYATGFLLERLFRLRLWDYSKNRLNLHGRVCLLYSLFWGLLGVVHVDLLYPPVLRSVQTLSPGWLWASSVVIVAALAVDLALSVVLLASFRATLARCSAERQSRIPLEDEYHVIVADILQNEEFLRLKTFRHHASSIFAHVQMVSYLSYRVSKRLGMDHRAAARGGLLHDFFLYDWHNHDLPELAKDKNHGWAHPRIALANSEKCFALNDIERDIILRHMWPFTLVPPRYVVSYIVCLVDKYVTLKEYGDVLHAAALRGLHLTAPTPDAHGASRPEPVQESREPPAGRHTLARTPSGVATTRRPRVKLITIPWSVEVPTLSLASLAAVTPEEMDVTIVDVLRERLVLDEPTDLVGITASTPSIKAAYKLADYYRACGSVVVIGGHHATAMPVEALTHADGVVCGEGEVSWARICDQFLTSPSRVAGVYRDPVPDLATLPQPRTDLIGLERYSPYAYPVTASRGCPSRCSYCFSRHISPSYRTFPLAHVVEQVRRRPPFVRGMYFVDDNLVADVDHARELFRALKRERVPFMIQARIEVARDPETLRLAHEAGCVAISTGYESVSQMSLDGAGKRADAAGYRGASRAIFDAGMVPSSNWMLGFDGDSPDCFDETLAFLDDSWVLDASFTTEIPFPGTAAFAAYAREGRILTHDYDEYVGKDHVVVRPKQMTPEQLCDGIRRLAKSFFSLHRVRSRLKLVASNPLLLDVFPESQRMQMAMLLGVRQAYHWRELMSPTLRWSAGNIRSTRGFLHLGEVLRHSNFERKSVTGSAPL